ncbi:MAG: TIGR02186 family protein [Hyphomicrobiales bacterium]|nr:TIGR02186 family protein [Hyphomicrobiales bacterium]
MKKITIYLISIFIIIMQYSFSNATERNLITQIDDPHIQIGSNFFGGELLVFGAISGRDLLNSDIIIKVEGKEKKATIREKIKKYGIWINDKATLVEGIPNFYAVHSNRNINRIIDKEFLVQEEIGVQNIKFKSQIDSGQLEYIYDAIKKKNKENSIFTENFTGIRIIGNKLFRSSIQLPMDIKEGTYEVSIFFFEDQVLIDSDISNIFVNKTLAGKYIYTQANEKPLLYGIIAVIIAWFAGLIIVGLARVT